MDAQNRWVWLSGRGSGCTGIRAKSFPVIKQKHAVQQRGSLIDFQQCFFFKRRSSAEINRPSAPQTALVNVISSLLALVFSPDLLKTRKNTEYQQALPASSLRRAATLCPNTYLTSSPLSLSPPLSFLPTSLAPLCQACSVPRTLHICLCGSANDGRPCGFKNVCLCKYLAVPRRVPRGECHLVW